MVSLPVLTDTVCTQVCTDKLYKRDGSSSILGIVGTMYWMYGVSCLRIVFKNTRVPKHFGLSRFIKVSISVSNTACTS